jgi:3-(3-hydroxy-phenyl)propionate hydroxylase
MKIDAEIDNGIDNGIDYQALRLPYRRSADQDAAAPARHPVVVVGAGPVGLTLAIDLAQRGVPVVVLDNDDRLSAGSRAICFAQRTLEIFDRLGCGKRMVGKGVSWDVGRVFAGAEELYTFNLLPGAGFERPAFINLQQYFVEGYLAERAAELPPIDLRWKHAVTAVEPGDDGVDLTVETPDGRYRLRAEHLVACDGSRSPIRAAMGLESHGRVFEDRFLIADVTMDAAFAARFPAERWFWFDPPFHPGQSVLLHRQPDGVWRIDFQLGSDADPEFERQPANIAPRVRALLAASGLADAGFDLVWASVYTFACTRMASFRHGRVLFAGDAAHRVSPFGARGANSGIQDADNLGWKLAAVLTGQADESLLASYAREREAAADENLLNSTRSTDFISPKSEISRVFRDAVLGLARQHAFARTLVNSGRLSLPTTYRDSPLSTADAGSFAGRMVPGAPAVDTPLRRADGSPSWLLRELDGSGFALLAWSLPADALAALLSSVSDLAPLHAVALGPGSDLADACGLAQQRYDLQAGTLYLLRPDRHVCARWRTPTAAGLRAALRRALPLAPHAPASPI